MNTKVPHTLIGSILLSSFLISACGPEEVDATPTFSVEAIQTMAVAAFSSGLTQTAMAMPTDTPTLTPSPTSTNTPAVTNTPGTPATSAGIPPTASCYGLAFVSDVTIPDNTNMTPGQKFTKTWRVRNNGSCTWEAGFKFAFTSGDAMESSTLTLDKAVSPGGETDLSVAMTAPNKQGTFRSNWRMSTASGNYFGDEVYVLIVVGGTASTTPTATATGVPATATATASPTETPTVTGTTG
jgi:hypothetical protein